MPAGTALARHIAMCERVQRLGESAFAVDGIESQLRHWLFGLCEAVRAHAGIVALGARELRVVAGVGGAFEVGALLPQQGVAAKVLSERDLVLGAAIELDPTTPAPLRDTLAVGLPIEFAGRALGVLAIWLPAGRTWPDSELSLLRTAIIGVAQHLHSAELLARERHRGARFELIAQVARLVTEDGDRDAMLQRVADAIHTTLGYPAVDIPTIDDDDRQHLTIRVRGGHYKHVIRQVDKVPLSQGIMGAAVREARTQYVNDVGGDARYIQPPGVDPPQAELAVPIRIDGRVVGVINVESPRRFSPLDVTTIETVAEFLAGALKSVERIAQTHIITKVHERERIANDVDTNLTQQLTQIHMLADTLEATIDSDRAKAAQRCQRLRELTAKAQRDLRALLERSRG